MRRLSVVIPNYNYEHFVGAAIESALGIEWPDLEVVVVDDGSTDGSLSVIESYRDRVVVVARANTGQRVAVNDGVARSSGDVVIILDSDDVLPSDVGRRLASVWNPRVSKAQFRMQRVDAQLRPIGDPFPTMPPGTTPNMLTRWMVRTSAYPTPPGSGNAYARWFLDLLMPLGPALGDASDSALLAAAPLLGDVVDVPQVVVGYRQHGDNDSNLLRDLSRFRREVERAQARWEFACSIAPSRRLRPATLRRSRELLQLRVGAHVAARQRGEAASGEARRLAIDVVRSPWAPGPEPWRNRLMIAMWCGLTTLAPLPVAHRLLKLRYGRGSS